MSDLLRRALFLPEQGSTIAPDVDRLHFFVIITTMIASTMIGLSAFYFFFKYRRRRVGQLTRWIEPNLLFEFFCVTVPLAFFLLWAFIGYRQYVRMQTPPKDAIDIYVMGKKWMWKFAYPDGPNSIAVLRVPANRPVRLLMTSRDVIHSFYVPGFRIKQDVLPGRYTQAWFEAVAPGRYQILCTEYCGVGHSIMWGEVIAMPPEEFDAWLSAERRGLANRRDIGDLQAAGEPGSNPAASMVVQGQRLSSQHGCFKCHSVDGSPHIGPTWLDMYGRNERLQDGNYVKVDESYITESMMDPRAKHVVGYDLVMPTYQGRLDAAETAAIIEFIRSLRSDVPGASPILINPPSERAVIGLPPQRPSLGRVLGVTQGGSEPTTSPLTPSTGAGTLNQDRGTFDPAVTAPPTKPPTEQVSPPRDNSVSTPR